MKTWFVLFACVTCVASSALAQNREQAESVDTPIRTTQGSPNIVFILVDDTGWNALDIPADPNIPGSGSTYYQTPNTSKLARSGIRFVTLCVFPAIAEVYLLDLIPLCSGRQLLPSRRSSF